MGGLPSTCSIILITLDEPMLLFLRAMCLTSDCRMTKRDVWITPKFTCAVICMKMLWVEQIFSVQ